MRLSVPNRILLRHRLPRRRLTGHLLTTMRILRTFLARTHNRSVRDRHCRWPGTEARPRRYETKAPAKSPTREIMQIEMIFTSHPSGPRAAGFRMPCPPPQPKTFRSSRSRCFFPPAGCARLRIQRSSMFVEGRRGRHQVGGVVCAFECPEGPPPHISLLRG